MYQDKKSDLHKKTDSPVADDDVGVEGTGESAPLIGGKSKAAATTVTRRNTTTTTTSKVSTSKDELEKKRLDSDDESNPDDEQDQAGSSSDEQVGGDGDKETTTTKSKPKKGATSLKSASPSGSKNIIDLNADQASDAVSLFTCNLHLLQFCHPRAKNFSINY